MKRLIVLVAVLAALVTAAPAHAVTISFDPSSTIVDVGDLVNIDVVISGLDASEDIVSAYDLDVTYNSSIVNATGVDFGPFLGGPGFVLEDFILSSGRIDFAAESLLTDQQLAALQPDSFVLATLSFIALTPGTTALNFDPVAPPGILIVSFGGFPIDPATIIAGTGEIVVRGPVQTPEPSTLWLGLVGLLAARELRRRRAR
jgi:hypothetical protein